MSSLSSTFHDAYHSLEEMDVFGDELAAKFGPLGIQVEKFSIGQTWEGREIRGWKAKMTDGKGDDKIGEREFVVQSGQHAREVGSGCTRSEADEVVGRTGFILVLPPSPFARG